MRKPSEIQTAFSPRESLDAAKRFFLVGIGGAGMSALARMLAHRNHQVLGTDGTRSLETDRLDAEGIPVQIGHSGDRLQSGDAVILTDAIDLDRSPEVARARELGLPLLRRSQALGWLLRDKRVIAVTGTHGKTTTTGMIGAGLRSADRDPLIVVGANVPEWGSSVVEGTGEWAVVEACEAYDAFHDLDPEMVVLTNLELDHVDYHGTWENLRASVVRFVERLPGNGWLIYCGEDRGASEVAELTDVRSVPYGIDKAWAIQIANSLGGRFPVERMQLGEVSETDLALPGRHNRLNGTGALMACAFAEADLTRAATGIAGFRGAERRLQVLFEGATAAGPQLTVIDDYAHHPTEVEASLRALRQRYPEKFLTVVFQPHLYSRTAPLIYEFAAALSNADEVILTDIYPAREDPMPGVSSARIAELVTVPVRYVPSRHLLPQKVARRLRPGQVLVAMGAGNIGDFAPRLVEELRRPPALAGAQIARPLEVAVIYGGDSAEREVSLNSGRAVRDALLRKGHRPFLADVSELLLGEGSVARFVGPRRPDAAFLAVHGTNAEDGALQGFFELLHLPYTGSGVQASAIAMDKALTKQVLARHGVRVPTGTVFTRADLMGGLRGVPRGPWVVKPNAQGSTVGLTFVEDERDLQPAVERALAYGDQVLVEEWIRGVELSVPVLNGKALPAVEIVPRSGTYDFASKYLPGATEEICPARISADAAQTAADLALAAHRALGCAGATRTDIILRGEDLFVLEVNNLPGLTGTSLLPNAAKAAGIDYDELVESMLLDALVRDAAKG